MFLCVNLIQNRQMFLMK